MHFLNVEFTTELLQLRNKAIDRENLACASATRSSTPRLIVEDHGSDQRELCERLQVVARKTGPAMNAHQRSADLSSVPFEKDLSGARFYVSVPCHIRFPTPSIHSTRSYQYVIYKGLSMYD
jgi:hypothetical protein